MGELFEQNLAASVSPKGRVNTKTHVKMARWHQNSRDGALLTPRQAIHPSNASLQIWVTVIIDKHAQGSV
jgi:hypothetical protein